VEQELSFGLGSSSWCGELAHRASLLFPEFSVKVVRHRNCGFLAVEGCGKRLVGPDQTTGWRRYNIERKRVAVTDE